MLGEQPVAQRADGPADALVAGRLQREIALGVVAHRPVAQVGRTDRDQFIVDD